MNLNVTETNKRILLLLRVALSLNFSLRSQNYWLCRLHETKRKLGAKGPEHESSLINEDFTNSDLLQFPAQSAVLSHGQIYRQLLI